MKFRTERLLLSTLSLDYLNEVHALHSLPAVDEFNTLGIPATLGDTKELLLSWLQLQETKPRLSFIFCIKLIATNEFIGLIALNLGKLHYKLGEVWFKTHPNHWRKGYTSEALSEVLKFAFETLKLHRVEAGCATGNEGSVKVLEKAGMVREGRKRELLPIRGRWVDNYFYAILDHEFEKR